MSETTRPVETYAEEGGVTAARLISSPVQNKVRSEVIAQGPAIPIIVVPGIMGSNLKANKDIEVSGKIVARRGEKIWRVDSAAGTANLWVWLWGIGNPRYGAAARQVMLSQENVEVDTDGVIVELSGMVSTQATPISKLPVAEARRRQWGAVSSFTYHDFMDWLQDELQGLGFVRPKKSTSANEKAPNKKLKALIEKLTAPSRASTDPLPEGWSYPSVKGVTEESVEKLAGYQFPVYGFGYNWLASCDLLDGDDQISSGKALADYIDATMRSHADCPGVILLTHSMGGLVARGAAMAENGGVKDKILGVIHTVMPTHGAGVFYKRMVSGLHNEGGGIKDWVFAKLLGRTAEETLPVLGNNPGPLQLAPNHRYNGGEPWLHIKSPQGALLHRLPISDPYEEIYLAEKTPGESVNAWWSVNPAWLNPANRVEIKDPWIQYKRSVAAAKNYHYKYADAAGFHPITHAYVGEGKEKETWGLVTWKASAFSRVKTTTVTHSSPTTMIPSSTDYFEDVYENSPIEPAATWERHPPESPLSLKMLVGGKEKIQVQILPPDALGDGTVPIYESAARVSTYCDGRGAQVNDVDHNGVINDKAVRYHAIKSIVEILVAKTVK